MKPKLWPITGVNVYDLPDTLRSLVFPYMSANEEDCVPQHEQTQRDSHRELKAVETGDSTTLVPTLPTLNTSNVLTFPNR